MLKITDISKYYDLVGEEGFYPRELIRFGQTLPYILKSGSLLDVGCGEGDWLKFLSEKTNVKLAGVDTSAVRLSFAKKKLAGKNIPLEAGNILKLNYKNNSFDQVTALQILEHVPEWQKGLSELVRVASKRVVVSVPYKEKLTYEICPKCGAKANSYGHLHSFAETDFESLKIDGKITFRKLPSAYLQRFAAALFGKAGKKIPGRGEKGNVICPKCYSKIPYTKHFERGINLLIRFLTFTPEYLLVQIDK